MNYIFITIRSWVRQSKTVPYLIVILFLIALFSHLGYLPLDTSSDEPRRALVALEMILSDDFITPTLNGELYFNKPPLYNWLIVSSFWLFGAYSSFAVRFPMAIALVLFGLTIFSFVRRYAPVPPNQSAMVAFVVAMMVLTNGRVLIYDSLWSSIDIPFAWLTYSAIMLVYHFDYRRNYWALFLTTYALTALGFLMKGLPAVVFQGMTVLSWFVYTRQFRRLWHPAHVVGVGLFLLITGSYYGVYFSRNHIPLTDVAGVLFDESTKRTVVTFGIGDTILHLLTFPFEMLFHFMPYLLLLFLLIRRNFVATIKAEPFIAFNTVVVLANILVYWSSPQVYARYLIGLLPLLFMVLVYFYYEKSNSANLPRKWIEWIWKGAALICTVGCWVALFHPKTRTIPAVFWKTLLTFGLMAISTWWLWQSSENRLARLVVVMIVLRIGFNWLVLPGRVASRQFYKTESERIARKAGKNGLFGYRQAIGSTGATDVNSFHIAALRGEILRKTDRKIPNAYYIADSVSLIGERYETIDTLRLFKNHPTRLVRFK